MSLETWNTATDTLVGEVSVPTGYTFVTGKADPARGRAVVLLRGSTQGASALLPIDLSTGTGASLIPLPVAADCTVGNHRHRFHHRRVSVMGGLLRRLSAWGLLTCPGWTRPPGP